MHGTRTTFTIIVLAITIASPGIADPLVLTGSVSDINAALACAKVELSSFVNGFQSGLRVLDGRAGPAAVKSAPTDDQGRYVLEVPEPGMWRIVVKAPGFVPMELSPLLVVESRELPPAQLADDKGARVEVRSAAGVPQSGIWVWMSAANSAAWSGVATNGWRPASRKGLTSDQGLLIVPRAAGERLDVTVFPSGLLTERKTVKTKASFLVPLFEPRGRTLTVHNSRGKPRPGILVRGGDLAWPLGLTGDDGSFFVTVDPAAEMPLWLNASDGSRKTAVLRSDPDGEGGPVRLTLAGPIPLSGRVLDAVTRRPLVGAFLWVSYEPATVVRSDDRGNFELPVPEAGTFSFQAEAVGYLPLLGQVSASDLEAGEWQTVALTPVATLSGRVASADGTPLAGARVEAFGQGEVERPRAIRPDRADDRTRSVEDGGFHFSRLVPGEEYELRARKPGFAPATVTVTASASSTANVRILLSESRTGYGIVLDLDERPIADALVTIRHSAQQLTFDYGPKVIRTDGQGRFTGVELSGSRVDLTASKPGYAPLRVRGVEIPPGGDAIDLGTMILGPAANIAGRVTDAEGRPLSGAEVSIAQDHPSSQASAAGSDPQEPVTVTANDGHFIVGDLVSGDRIDLLIQRSGFLTTTVKGVRAPAAKLVTVVMKPAAGIRGRVTNGEGAPIPDAEVTLEAFGHGADSEDWLGIGSGFSGEASTDERGRFEIAGVIPGGAELQINADGYQPHTISDLGIRAGEVFDDLEIVLVRGETLTGRVLTTGDEPIAGARVSVGAASADSAADGSYRVTGLARGRQEVEVAHRHFGFMEREAEIDAGINTLDLVFDRGYEVTGRVIDESGRGLLGARVLLREVERWREYRALADDDGAFRLEPVTDGEYRLQAGLAGFAPGELTRPVVVDGAEVADLELRLTPGATVTGRIRGLHDEDLALVGVVAESEGKPSRDGRVDFAGNYKLTDLAAGDWRVKAALPRGGRQATAVITLERGQAEARQDLNFGSGLSLTGQVLYNREPLGDAMAYLNGHSVAAERSVTTDHQGNFRIDDLEPGRYRLQVSAVRYGVTDSRDIDLGSDQDLLVELVTTRVAGQVVDEKTAQPLHEAMVVLTRIAAAVAGDERAFMISLPTKEDGTFSLPQVTPGRYRLIINMDGYIPDEQILDVDANSDYGNLRLPLSPTAGLALQVLLASGRVPRYVSVAVLDPAGQPVLVESQSLDGDGRVRFSSVPPGHWTLLVNAPGGAAAELAVDVPGEPIALSLAPANRLRVRVAELVAADRVGTLTLIRPDGRLWRTVEAGVVRQKWPITAGHSSIAGLPDGAWTVQAATPDGRQWSGSVAAAAGVDAQVDCHGGTCFSALAR